ncbi:hypothetical protein F5876DRAFT_78364 [Lentinula aff. lateritia]|uniref:Uncharacterized protein n=1 Tax=Lentinula aff. lateritia TaxID=2804960 RepID=A0ACC1TWU6_9AGAR|nr:hypothetical protein F5876DRAFT_78364 [Lentinula aff. lateritia]
MDEPVPSITSSREFQKRVLPSRSRRGGPGVGNCETDLMILDTFKRQSENDPLIPKDTPFFLTTDSNLAPSEASTSSINARGYERYFDRPDVIEGYREQKMIETPVFEAIGEGEGVVSRFRPRIVETQAVDTSDEVYLQRHRKYEKFEKRQRLREKEKLQHEQYKLRERVEQLRAMDYSAFLALPASSFPLFPDGQELDASGQLLNGSSVAEGERRKKEMLAVAQSLEERYKILLPPSQKWRKYLSASAEGDEQADLSAAASTSKQYPLPDDRESEVEEKEDLEEDSLSKQPIKLKLNFSKSVEPPVKRSRPPKKEKKYKNDVLFPSPPPERFKPLSPPTGTPRKISSLPPSAPSPMHPEIATLSIPDSDQILITDEIDQLAESSQSNFEPLSYKSNEKRVASKRRGRLFRNKSMSPSDVVLDGSAEALVDELATPTPEAPPSVSQPVRKKRRTTVAVDESFAVFPDKESGLMPPPPPPEAAIWGEFISAPVARRSLSRAPPRIKKECGLVLAAQNYEKGSSRIRRQRHNIAWGFKVPSDVTDLEMDFELPLWLLHDDTFQLRFSLHTGFEEDPRYTQQINPLFKLNPRFINGERVCTPESERLANALETSHREHGEESQSEDSGSECEDDEGVKKALVIGGDGLFEIEHQEDDVEPGNIGGEEEEKMIIRTKDGGGELSEHRNNDVEGMIVHRGETDREARMAVIKKLW